MAAHLPIGEALEHAVEEAAVVIQMPVECGPEAVHEAHF